MKKNLRYFMTLLLMMVASVGWAEEEVYSTGFESGFGTSTTYNNTTEKEYGPTGGQWATYYGTVSTNNALSGNNSIQCRYYGSAATVEPYAKMNFDVYNVTSITFKSKVSNTNLSLLLQYSTNEGTSWNDAQTFALTTTATDYTYTFTEKQSQVRFKFLVKHASTISSSNQQFYLDDVSILGVASTITVASPTFSPEAGEVASGTTVTLSQPDADMIMYTTDGTNPSFANN